MLFGIKPNKVWGTHIRLCGRAFKLSLTPLPVKYRLQIMALVGCLAGCNRDAGLDVHGPSGSTAVTAFDYSIAGDCTTSTLVVHFQNRSDSAKDWLWKFGDGATSLRENPSHVYARAGNYRTWLIAYRIYGVDSVEEEVGVYRNSDGRGPLALFSFEREDTSSYELSFTVLADSGSAYLDFGDGTLLRDPIPMHVFHGYPGPGTYDARLSVSNANGGNCDEVHINLTP